MTAWHLRSIALVALGAATTLSCQRAPPAAEVATTSIAAPGETLSAPTAASAAATASAVATAAASPPPAPAGPAVRCSAARDGKPMFLGRIMGFRAHIVDVDALGIIAVGGRGNRSEVRRIAKDPPVEPRLKQEPVNQILAAGYEDYLLTSERLYTLEATKSAPFNSRLAYVPARAEAGTVPTVLIPEANRILGEWDGWLYALRSRPEFDAVGLGRQQVEAVLATNGDRREDLGGVRGYWWRFSYDLVRARPEGKPEVIGVVPGAVDAYFDGRVYGRYYDRASHELGIFRLPVAGGAREVIYRRKAGWGRGGVWDHIGNLAVDGDGVFFYDAEEGVVRKLPHAGGEASVLVRNLAFHVYVRLMGNYLVVGGEDHLKSGRMPTLQIEPDSHFGSGRWTSESWSEGRKDDLKVVLGRERGEGFWGQPRGFVYQYSPEGIIKARRFEYEVGYIPSGSLGFDDECIYYTASDWSNTWFYALPERARRR